MGLEHLGRPTPESRTPYLLAAMAVIGIAAAAWRVLVATRFGAELLLTVAAGAVAAATWRYVRERRRRISGARR